MLILVNVSNQPEIKKDLINTSKLRLVKNKVVIAENSTPVNNKTINKNIFNSSKKIEKNITKNVIGSIVKISNNHQGKAESRSKLHSNFLNFSKNLPIAKK